MRKREKNEILCTCLHIEYCSNYRFINETSDQFTYYKRRNFCSVHIFAQGLRSAKFDLSENYYHNSTNRINGYVRENLTTPICLLVLEAQKYSCAKISTFTVYDKFHAMEMTSHFAYTCAY